MTAYVDEYCDVLLGQSGSVFLVMAGDAYETPSWPDRATAIASLRAVVAVLEEAS